MVLNKGIWDPKPRATNPKPLTLNPKPLTPRYKLNVIDPEVALDDGTGKLLKALNLEAGGLGFRV